MNPVVTLLGKPTFQYQRHLTVNGASPMGDSYWWLDVDPKLAIEAKRLDPINVRLIDQPGMLSFEVNLFTSKAIQSNVG